MLVALLALDLSPKDAAAAGAATSPPDNPGSKATKPSTRDCNNRRDADSPRRGGHGHGNGGDRNADGTAIRISDEEVVEKNEEEGGKDEAGGSGTLTALDVLRRLVHLVERHAGEVSHDLLQEEGTLQTTAAALGADLTSCSNNVAPDVGIGYFEPPDKAHYAQQQLEASDEEEEGKAGAGEVKGEGEQEAGRRRVCLHGYPAGALTALAVRARELVDFAEEAAWRLDALTTLAPPPPPAGSHSEAAWGWGEARAVSAWLDPTLHTITLNPIHLCTHTPKP